MPPRIDWERQLGRRMRLRDLHVFATTVRLGSMAKAAKELGVSQPAVSEVIAELEHTLGVRLLDRVPRGVEPTVYGSALLRRSIAAFDELRQGIKEIEFLCDPTAGELRIGCPESIAAGYLQPVIARFTKAHPRVVLDVDTVNTQSFSPKLRERSLDLVLARGGRPLDEPSLVEDFAIESALNNSQYPDLVERFAGLGAMELQGSIGTGRQSCDSGGHEAPPTATGTGRSAAPAAGRQDQWAA